MHHRIPLPIASTPTQAPHKKQLAIILFSSAPVIHSDMKKILIFLFCFKIITGAAQSAAPIATIGQPLPPWREGWLDLHHINTGRGNAAFYILPDGTTIPSDAGEPRPDRSPAPPPKRNYPHPAQRFPPSPMNTGSPAISGLVAISRRHSRASDLRRHLPFPRRPR